jgi:hypothetical protein
VSKPSTEARFCLVLAANKESMHLDPVNWLSVMARLREWSPIIEVPDITDCLFRERLLPTHQPRVSTKNNLSRQMRTDFPSVYSFHRPLANTVDKKQLRRTTLSPGASASLAKINQHKFSLTALGILPNDLRKLLLVEGYDPEPLIDALRKTLFWGSYRIWRKRKRLVRLYWDSVGRSQLKRHRRWKGNNESACGNSFHFLKKVADLSKQRLTRCPCSCIARNRSPSPLPDIRSHFVTQQHILPKSSKQNQTVPSHLVMDSLDHKHVPAQTNAGARITQSDAIRAEHDRGKKRKMTQLTINQILPRKKRKNS